MDLNVIDLFSGIGGFSLGLHNSDPRFKTIAFCEIDPFCQKVLQKNFSGIKIYDDIKDFKNTEPAFLVCGGFPCQGFSQAGLRRGTKDDRYLWGEMFAVIKQVKPRWIIAENVRGIVTTQDGLAFDTVHSDLESENYEVRAFNLPACGKGAWHRRERIFFIANLSDTNERDAQARCERQRGIREESEGQWISSDAASLHETLFDSSLFGLEKYGHSKTNKFVKRGKKTLSDSDIIGTQVQTEGKHAAEQMPGGESEESWWEIESELRGVPDGVSTAVDRNRVNRLKALGNAVVPQVVEEIGRAIIKAEFING